jgi:hypothetical protein
MEGLNPSSSHFDPNQSSSQRGLAYRDSWNNSRWPYRRHCICLMSASRSTHRRAAELERAAATRKLDGQAVAIGGCIGALNLSKSQSYFSQILSNRPLTAPPTSRDPPPGGFTYSSALFVVGAPDCSLRSLSKLTLGAVSPLSTGPVTTSEFGAPLVEGLTIGTEVVTSTGGLGGLRASSPFRMVT